MRMSLTINNNKIAQSVKILKFKESDPVSDPEIFHPDLDARGQKCFISAAASPSSTA
jgi:hypothetical protein